MQDRAVATKTAVNWFSIPASFFDRAVRFYETILETPLLVNDLGGEKIGVFAYAGDGVGGAVTSGTPSDSGTLVYLNVDGRLDRTLALVARAGGTVDLEKTPLPREMGYIAHIFDTEGNRIGLHAKS